MSTERDYVLGTHDEEIERLGLQHRVWLPRASDAWRRAGFSVGHTLLDVGCGPGWATLDLAGIAGPTGRAHGRSAARRPSSTSWTSTSSRCRTCAWTASGRAGCTRS